MKINGRFINNKVTGVERVAFEMSKRLNIPFLEYPSAGWKGHIYEQLVVPFLAREGYISFCNIGPVFVKNHILYIHDLAVIEHPEWYSKKFHLFYSIIWPILSKTCKKIVTDSEYSKRKIVELLKVPEDKVHVIYLGVSDFFSNPPTVDVAKFGLVNKKYILSVGSIEPRKNLSSLIKAWHNTSLKREGYKLVLVGGVIGSFNQIELSLDSSIIKTGHVADEELLSLYKNALGFVYMSFYEGFGLPVLEAMKSEIPVLTSNTTSLLEVASGYALTCAPDNINEISRSLDKLKRVTDEDIKKSKQYADTFTWDNSVSKLNALIRKITL